MKFNRIIKFIPFLSLLLLIIFLNISNKKDYTNLKILIWNTPPLSLGSYLAISTSAGFILSFFITNNIANIKHNKQNRNIKYKTDTIFQENNQNNESNNNIPYEYTLFERDEKDPSPTINANFRVISKTNRSDFTYEDNINNNNVQHENSAEFEEEYYKQNSKDEDNINESSISTDWSDDSYLCW